MTPSPLVNLLNRLKRRSKPAKGAFGKSKWNCKAKPVDQPAKAVNILDSTIGATSSEHQSGASNGTGDTSALS